MPCTTGRCVSASRASALTKRSACSVAVTATAGEPTETAATVTDAVADAAEQLTQPVLSGTEPVTDAIADVPAWTERYRSQGLTHVIGAGEPR